MNTPNSNPHYNWPTHASTENEYLLAGRYRLLDKIGEGGAAEVFRALDERLDRVVAVKLLRPQYLSDPTWRKRFVIEAKAAAGLSHPNIAKIYDFGEGPDGAMYIAMQYVEGHNLSYVLRRHGRMSPREVMTLATQVCSALSMAHHSGLIHRDVKPQNIMIDSFGGARLLDFGIVKALSGPTLTQSGITFGTAAYLSPEQATGGPVGPASDIYALGCVMYEMLTGSPPFTGDDPLSVAYKQVWELPRPPREVVPGVPDPLNKIVIRCLEKDPNARYATAEELALDLEKASNQSNRAVPPVRVQTSLLPVAPQPQPTAIPMSAAIPHSAHPNSSAQATHISPRRHTRWLTIAAILALVCLGLLSFVVGQNGLFTAGRESNPPSASPTSVAVSQAPPVSPTSVGQPIPAATPSAVPPTASPTVLSTPPAYTDTPLPVNQAIPVYMPPPPPATDTAEPPAPSSTSTPTPPPPTNTPAPPVPAKPQQVVKNTPLPTRTARPSKSRKPTNAPLPPPTYTPIPLPPTSTDAPEPPAPIATVSTLERAVAEAMARNPKAVAEYLNGKKTALLTLLHDIWDQAKGKIDLNAAREALLKKLEELRH